MDGGAGDPAPFATTPRYAQLTISAKPNEVRRRWMEVPARIEPAMGVLQTPALPLGYGTIYGSKDSENQST